MQDPARLYAYCIFCNTVKSDLDATVITQKYGYTAFSPKIVQRKWIKGKCFEEVKPYLPGYVFMYVEKPITQFREINILDGVLRFLGQRENGFQLTGDDRRFADMLYLQGGVIGIVKTYKEGDRVPIAKDLMGGFEGEIIKLEKRKGRCLVQYNFDNNTCQMWVGYDMIKDDMRPPKLGEETEEK